MNLIRHVGTLSVTMYLLSSVGCLAGVERQRVSTWPGLHRGSVVMASTHMEPLR